MPRLFEQDIIVIQYKQPASGAIGEPVFFVAPENCTFDSVVEVHGTAGNDGSAVSLDVEILDDGIAAGSGTVITATGFDLKAAANTLQTCGIKAGGPHKIKRNQRLAVKLTGTPTAVNNVVVTIVLIRRLK